MPEDAPKGPVITPNGLPVNQEPPGGGFPVQPNWKAPAPGTESQLPPDWHPPTGNQMPNPNPKS